MAAFWSSTGLGLKSCLAWGALVGVAIGLEAAFAAPSDEIKVTSFNPTGFAKQIGQVKARFSGDAVNFGDPRAEDPFTVECQGIKAPGRGRWVDSRNWVLDLGKSDLPAGVTCSFKTRPDFKTAGGKPISGTQVFSFHSGGPNIKSSEPYDGGMLSEDAVLVARLDGVPDLGSVEKLAYFVVKGLKEKIGVRVLTGTERDAILKSTWNKRQQERVVVLRATQNFPANADVQFVWGKGIKTKSGVATSADQTLGFKVQAPFTVRFSCQRENKDADCLPISSLELSFSENVELSLAQKVQLQMPDGSLRKPDFGDKPTNTQSGLTFKGVFPEKSLFKIILPKDFVDLLGRKPDNAGKFPLEVRTDAYPPLAKFSSRFGIIESAAGGLLPVTIRRLEKDVKLSGAYASLADAEAVAGKSIRVTDMRDVIYWKSRADRVDREISIFDRQQRLRTDDAGGDKPSDITIPAVSDFKMPGRTKPEAFEVIGIPLKKPGFYVVELTSNNLGAALLGKQAPMHVPATALVTNLSVHFKWGQESSLVWVTSLDKGLPVSGASVEVLDCDQKPLARGTTDKDGILSIKDLGGEGKVRECNGRNLGEFSYGVTVVARKTDDMAFVHSSWTDGIEKWRFKVNYGWDYRPRMIRTVLDRSLFRAGETVSMKHYSRRRTMSGFALNEPDFLPKKAIIIHYGSDTKIELPLAWDGAGVAETTWKIPKSAKLGTWALSFDVNEEHSYGGGASFRVEEFRLPLLKGSIQGPAKSLIRPKEFPVDIAVSYLSGGGATQLPVKIRRQLRTDRGAHFSEYRDFAFSRGPVKEGREGEDRYSYDGYDEGESEESTDDVPAPADGGASDSRGADRGLVTGSLVLDSQGAGRYVVRDLEKCDACSVVVEAEYADPSGEIQTISQTIPTFASERLVAIAADSWVAERDRLKFKSVVVTPEGKPVAGALVEISLFEREYFSHRKRLVGGFYSYESYSEVKALGALCKGTTDQKGEVQCEGKPPKSGDLIAQAVTKDGDGRVDASTAEVWVPGDDQWWWRPGDSDRVDLLPEKKHYEPGETARFQLRAPFQRGKILVTVEREGVIKGWVQDLDGRSPVISVQIEDTYAPNVYVSAFVVRGRADEVKPTALVDLGRPAFKMGVAEVNVGWRAHELKVSVKADRDVYKVREKAKIKIHIATAKGDALPSRAEVAIAAVDQGLLELNPNPSWRLLDEMMGQRKLDVGTSTAQMRVVGKRHFGLKALPSGGGGGEQATRELFDTLLLWKGRVPVSPQGDAEVEIPLNDSLTTFKIVAIASAGVDRFGSGDVSIRTTQDIMLMSGLPQLARQGDKLTAIYTLRNTTDVPREISLTLKTTPSVAALAGKPTQSVTIGAGESKEVTWNLIVPETATEMIYEAEAKSGAVIFDRIKTTQKVVQAIPVRTFQATIAQLEPDLTFPVETPADAEKGRGGIHVDLVPTLTTSLEGVRRYMAAYPYSCMEQKVSRAVALRDKKLWSEAMAQLPSHLDSEGFVMYFPGGRYGSDVLTSYVLTIADAAGWAIPNATKEQMVSAMEKFVSGKSLIMSHDRIRAADLPFRKLSALVALAYTSPNKFRDQYLTSIDLQPDLWPTSAVIDWYLLLRKVKSIKNNAERLKHAEEIFRTRMTLNGTRMDFSTGKRDYLWWLMVSVDSNSVRMLHALIDAPGWKVDMPRLVKAVLGRQLRGHWDLTTANAWGVLAVEKFSKAFESQAVAGKTSVTMANQTGSVQWSDKKAERTIKLLPPAGKEQLLVSHSGTGKPWAVVQALFAIPLKEALSAGYKISKTIEPVEQKKKGEWSRGDIARVKIKVESQQEMTWVVINDPVPTGSAILGSGLGRDSAIATQGQKSTGHAWPAFEERSFEAFRAYYDWTPRGEWTFEYTVRFNNPGEYQTPETRVEAMYAPEIFGEAPNPAWKIGR